MIGEGGGRGREGKRGGGEQKKVERGRRRREGKRRRGDKRGKENKEETAVNLTLN